MRGSGVTRAGGVAHVAVAADRVEADLRTERVFGVGASGRGEHRCPERVAVVQAELPGVEVVEGGDRGIARRHRGVGAQQRGGEGVLVEPARVCAEDRPGDAAVTPLPDHAEAVDQEVVADVAPALRLDVIGVDPAQHARHVGGGVVVGRVGVVDETDLDRRAVAGSAAAAVEGSQRLVGAPLGPGAYGGLRLTGEAAADVAVGSRSAALVPGSMRTTLRLLGTAAVTPTARTARRRAWTPSAAPTYTGSATTRRPRLLADRSSAEPVSAAVSIAASAAQADQWPRAREQPALARRRRRLQQLERIGRSDTHRKDEQAGQVGDRRQDAGRQATRKYAAQAARVVDSEHLVQPRRAHVGVDQQGAPTELTEGYGQVGGNEALAVTGVSADDSQCAPLAVLLEPADQLASNASERLGDTGERRGRRDQFGVELLASFERVRVVKLLTQSPQHITVVDQLQRHRCFAEQHVVFTLVRQDRFDLVRVELARFPEYLSKRQIPDDGLPCDMARGNTRAITRGVTPGVTCVCIDAVNVSL